MPKPYLDREEYIEQAHFFRVYRERLDANVPAQEILVSVKEEILATTKLPMAIDFLAGEIVLTGRVSDGMARLPHYFSEFQTFVISQAENDYSRFDHRTALEILQREAEYRQGSPTPAGLFVYQFECISRNKLGYDPGMVAMAADPLYDKNWSDWILRCRLKLGSVEFTDLISVRSEHYVNEMRRTGNDPDFKPPESVLFGAKEGRIAVANRGRDPLYMFAALQRHLGYPAVPRPLRANDDKKAIPALQAKIQQLEKRISLLEREAKDDFDLSQFYVKQQEFSEEGDNDSDSDSGKS